MLRHREKKGEERDGRETGDEMSTDTSLQYSTERQRQDERTP